MKSPLEGWLARLEALHPKSIDLGLARVVAVRDAMGLQPGFPVVLVGGTNGKGSTCAYLEAMLAAAGYRVGLYTSPHLLRYNERVRIDACEVDDDAIARDFEQVDAARGDTSLTYFEFGTLAAMRRFVATRVDVAILEVGLGGRLDAVNVFEPACAIVTGVDLDHQAWLGEDRETIGFEKAGIFRAHVPAICAEADPPCSVIAHAQAIGARLLRADADYFARASGDGWAYRGATWAWPDLPLPALAGAHQIANAAGALAALEALRERLPVGRDAVERGLRDAHPAGRFQVVAHAPDIILDVAHNPHAARALAQTLAEQPCAGETMAVFSALNDKPARDIARALAPHVARWWVYPLDSARATPVEALARAVEAATDRPVTCAADMRQALDGAREAAGAHGRILAFGSFLTVADALCLLP
jgi:dihydrofolate synthase/folylpolyglutamate synthase